MSEGFAESRSEADPFPTVRLFGISVARVTTIDAAAQIVAWSQDAPARTVITANLDHVLKLRHDAAFRAAYDAADLITADGMPFVWLSQREGEALPERVTGSDLIIPICQAAASAGQSIYLFGSTDERLASAESALRGAAPGLRVAGRYAPPFGFSADDEAAAHVEADLLSMRPDIVFAALGAPKQELWSQRMAARVSKGVFVNIGGGLDFLAGDVRRAPSWLQRHGLEWAWRAASEPARLAPRYARILCALPMLLRQHQRDRRRGRSQL